jgi:hypothetical protein
MATFTLWRFNALYPLSRSVCVSEPVWAMLRRENLVVPAGNRTSSNPACFDHSSNTCRGLRIMMLLLVQSSVVTRFFIRLLILSAAFYFSSSFCDRNNPKLKTGH